MLTCKLLQAVVLVLFGALAVDLPHVFFRDASDKSPRKVDAIVHCLVDIAAHFSLVDPALKKRERGQIESNKRWSR